MSTLRALSLMVGALAPMGSGSSGRPDFVPGRFDDPIKYYATVKPTREQVRRRKKRNRKRKESRARARARK